MRGTTMVLTIDMTHSTGEHLLLYILYQ